MNAHSFTSIEIAQQLQSSACKVTIMCKVVIWCLYKKSNSSLFGEFFLNLWQIWQLLFSCLQWWKKKWPYTIPWFKAHTDIAAFTRWQCTDRNYLYIESSNESCWTITEYTLLCNPCEGSHQQCTSEHGIISHSWNFTFNHGIPSVCILYYFSLSSPKLLFL